MKSISCLVLIIILSLTCKDQHAVPVDSDITNNVSILEVEQNTPNVDSINPFWNCYENRNLSIEIVSPEIINDSLIKPFIGKIAISDLNKILVLHNLNYTNTDTSTLVDFEIFGYSPKSYRIKNSLEPYYNDDNKIDIKKLTFDNNGNVSIPYSHDLDGESTVLTIWKLQNDSLEYVGHYKNIFVSKYSNVWPLQYYNGFRNSYLLGETTFGEGGEYGEEYWIGKIEENNILQINSIYTTGWGVSDDTIKTLTFNKNNHSIQFYENFYKNTNEQINEKDFLFKKKVAKFELK
jgi:hypothetical protein